MNRLKISSGELAKICGVSQGTVDRAINNRPDIKKETKEKILETAKLYGYRKQIENTDGTEFVGQVGIIIFNLNNEYFSELVMEIENSLMKMGFCAIVMITHYDKSREIECIRNMYNMGVAGIILCSVNCGEVFDNYLSMFDIPIVAVGNNIGKIPYIGIDDFNAMRDMTCEVKKSGYNNLLYYSPSLKYPDAYAQIRRYKGFEKESGDCKTAVVTDIEELLKKEDTFSDKCAIICSTDFYAMEVYIKLNKPENIKITGFDNLKTIEKYKLPVDSVGYSIADIASAAAEAVVYNKRKDVIFNYEIVKRQNKNY